MATVKVAFGADMSIHPAAKSQREQGAAGFLRSAILTVNGKAPSKSQIKGGFRLTIAQMPEYATQRTGRTGAGSVTLTVGTKGPKGKSVSEADFIAQNIPHKVRRAAKPATAAPSAE